MAREAESVQTQPIADAVEAKVQLVLGELEQCSPEIQLAIYQRLLSGLALKLTAAIATKGIAAAVTEGAPAKSKSPSARARTSSRPIASGDVPRADSLLRQMNDATDPMEAWQRYGGSADQLFEVLRYEPTGVLEAMLLHRNMPQGPRPKSKSREKLAETIAVRLEQHFRGN